MGAFVEPYEELPVAVARSPWRLAGLRLRRDWVALASIAFIVLLVVFALVAPVFQSWTGHQIGRAHV